MAAKRKSSYSKKKLGLKARAKREPCNKYERDFLRFHCANLHVYELFKKFTFQKVRQGHQHLGALTVLHRIRWETGAVTNDPDFKINNNHAAYYARLFRDDYPEHREFFRTRRVNNTVKDSI